MERFAFRPGPSAALVLVASERGTDALGETNILSRSCAAPAFTKQVRAKDVISS